MDSLIFLNTFDLWNYFCKRETVGSFNRNIFGCNTQSFYKNMSKISNVLFIFQEIEIFFININKNDFVNNFSELLLWKINILDNFNIVDFIQIFVVSQSTKILIDLKFWSRP